MHIGVNVDTSAKLQLITTQSMPEGISENLKLNVSISMIKILKLYHSFYCIFFQDND